jgi:uncharacterized protein (DUF433 family)
MEISQPIQQGWRSVVAEDSLNPILFHEAECPLRSSNMGGPLSPIRLAREFELVFSAILGKMGFMEPTASQNEDFSAAVGTLSVIREHIVSTSETCGGKPRIAGTRIQVKHVVVMHERQGMTPEQIVSEYPHLTLSGIYAALAYYHDNREEVNADIRAEREWYEEMKASHPSRLQQKLEARKSNASDDTLSPR